ncbi:MAG: putative metalloprotease CJM1_0395 family protein [Bryobacteraceae bacterium]
MNGLDSTGAASALSAQEVAELSRLRSIDRRVRAHEQAHLAAAGQYARGGPSFQYVTGPDQQLYAVAGEVPIDASPVEGDPQATIRKMLSVIAAAHAPADPSPQDNQVAAQAGRELARAQAELVKQAYAVQSGTASGRSGGLLNILA